MYRILKLIPLLLLAGTVTPAQGAEEARAIVKAAIEHWRGISSYGVMTMVIHRPDWERTMSMRAWTSGQKRSLVRVTAPRKDAGNGTLMVDNNMWSFSPKINRVIKLPSSMMGQSWMGSDFSNKDVSRADTIVDQYDHTLLETRQQNGHKVFVIESIPHEEAAVVWGKELLQIRDDKVLLEQGFYDQDGVLVKRLVSREIGERGGRTIAIRQRMSRVEAPEEWTEVYVDEMAFDVALSDSLFTRSNLRNPRR